MLAWVPRIAALSFVLCSMGCGTGETAQQADPAPEARQAAEPVEESIEDEEFPDDDEAPVEADVDEMDEHALEAACFAGQQAACDQLGH